ncbi:MAG: hemolysin III family protein [Clostridia bacterium]|nr:hemolysin III family protein [Clostridia bacterium]
MSKIIKKKRYTVGEEIFSAVSHGIGAGLSVAALVTMIVRAARSGDGYAIIAAAIFGAALVILYTMSTLYHALTPVGAKKIFRIFDHATIFLLIAGTYTPYLLVTMRGTVGWILFCILWALTAIGIVFDAIMLERFHKIEMVLYVAMGWCIVVASKTLVASLAPGGLILLLAGGVLYTLGIIFYSRKKIRYMHSIWHLFVLAGSILHYFSVYLYVL